jgi:hypothetical protein
MSNLEVKAHRIARTPDAVTITRREGVTIEADIRGDTATYHVAIDPSGSRCQCTAHQMGRRMCSHIKALHLYETYGAVWAAERRARTRQLQRDWEDVT